MKGTCWRQHEPCGIGHFRISTARKCSALVELGFATLDWSNPITSELISDDDLVLFDAFTDTPSCVKFEQNYHRFPNSRFIYTTRPAADWQRSYESHLKRNFHVSNFEDAKERTADKDAVRHGSLFVEIYSSLYFSHDSYATAFDAYDRRVRQFFSDKPWERFIEFNMFSGDGWAKLCAFLGRDIPSEPFPWDNRTPLGIG